MKITNWILHNFWKHELRKTKSLSYAQKIEGEAIVSNCVLEILARTSNYRAEIEQYLYKLSIKTIQNIRSRVSRDDRGGQKILPNPLFTEEQIARLRNKFIWSLFAIIVLMLGEGVLNYLLGNVFVPKADEYHRALLAVGLTLGIMIFTDFCLAFHFAYLEAKIKYGKNELTSGELTKYNHQRIVGYFVLVLTLLILIYAGLTRIYYFKHLPPEGMTAELLKSRQQSSAMASYLTFFYTLAAGIVSGFLKRQISEIGVPYSVYRAWNAAHVRRNNFSQEALYNAKKIDEAIAETIHKYRLILIDIKRTLSMDDEFDAKYGALNEEYLPVKNALGFMVTGDIYRKYMPLQVAHLELFPYGVMHDPAILKITEELQTLRTVIDAHIEEHTNVLEETKEPEIHTNGNGHNAQLFNNKNHRVMNTKLLSVIVAFFMLQSCGKAEKSEHLNSLPFNKINLIDFSISDSSALQWYGYVISQHVIRDMGQKDRTVVLPIDYGSQSASQEIFFADFSVNQYSNELAGMDAEENAIEIHKDSLAASAVRFKAAFADAISDRREFGQGTDIIGGLKQALKYLRPGYRNVIILMSDGQNSTKGLDIEKQLNTIADVDKFIHLADSLDFKNTEVFILTGEQRKITPEKYLVLEAFWRKYFIKCHGNLLDYSSGALSRLDDLFYRPKVQN